VPIPIPIKAPTRPIPPPTLERDSLLLLNPCVWGDPTRTETVTAVVALAALAKIL
ncbi:hypothetical protein FRC15_007892, partial [Serendipita sp. 397]